MNASNSTVMTNKQPGFTLVELVATILLIGILVATVVPRFFGTHGFEERGFYDEAKAALRYAQKTAIAQRRHVCVIFAVKSVTVRIAAAYSATPAGCDTDLIGPDGATPYTIDSSASASDPRYRNTDIQFSSILFGGAAATMPATLTFNPSGSPNSSATITVRNIAEGVDFATPIMVEAETGYVH